MKIQGTVKQVFPAQSGISKSTGNAWQKQEFIVEYVHGEYPKEILLSTMESNIIGKLAVGQEVEVTFDFTVKTWKNPQGIMKYFNEPRIWRDGLRVVSNQSQAQAASPQQPAQQPAAQAAPPQQQQAPVAPAVGSQPANTGGDDQLPF